jgi:hypothetical protein
VFKATQPAKDEGFENSNAPASEDYSRILAECVESAARPASILRS